jgi:toxin ParE1/3/4
MSQYILSPQAEQSLIQISDYTLKNYGESQRKKYLKQLRDKMRLASKNPDGGQKRDDIKAGYYSIRAEKHYIYYRDGNIHIEIIDVLHQSMEPRLHL